MERKRSHGQGALPGRLHGLDRRMRHRRRASAGGARRAGNVQLPSARYQIDPARNRVWLLTPEGVFVYDLSRPERVAVPLPGWV